MDLPHIQTGDTMVRAGLEENRDPSYKVTEGKSVYLDNAVDIWVAEVYEFVSSNLFFFVKQEARSLTPESKNGPGGVGGFPIKDKM